ncbi:MAG: acetyl-CoA carboxylase biotin carboxyl carrier protein [Armatimonadota bacterium]
MEIVDIEKLLDIVRDAGISELSVSVNSPEPTTVRLRKPLAVKRAAKKPKTARIAEPVSDELFITAPMVGIFHAVQEMAGSTIRLGQVIGSIESMKLMNDVVSDHEGVVVEMLVDDGTPVEYGQHLLRLGKG